MFYPHHSGPPTAPHHSVWAIIGIVLAVLLGIGGLVAVAWIVLVVVALSHFGSNK